MLNYLSKKRMFCLLFVCFLLLLLGFLFVCLFVCLIFFIIFFFISLVFFFFFLLFIFFWGFFFLVFFFFVFFFRNSDLHSNSELETVIPILFDPMGQKKCVRTQSKSEIIQWWIDEQFCQENKEFWKDTCTS